MHADDVHCNGLYFLTSNGALFIGECTDSFQGSSGIGEIIVAVGDDLGFSISSDSIVSRIRWLKRQVSSRLFGADQE
jgi:hypothetical protein